MDFYALIRAREKRDRLKRDYEEADREYKEIQDQIWAEMEDNGTKTLTVDLQGIGTVQFGRRQTVYSRIIDRDVAVASLKAAGLDHMVKQDFEKRMLNELIREQLEMGQPPLDGIDYTTTNYVSISRKD